MVPKTLVLRTDLKNRKTLQRLPYRVFTSRNKECGRTGECKHSIVICHMNGSIFIMRSIFAFFS